MELSAIIDRAAIQSMMDDFYILTGIGVAIVDLNGKVLVATGWQDICTQFHRTHPQASRNCLESDTLLSNGVEPGTFRIYRCKNNMWDIATPITVDGQRVGNLFLGQFLFDDETPDLAVFRAQARQFGFDEKAYLAALERVPRWRRETVDTVMRFYSKLAQLISELGYGNARLTRSLAQRDGLLDSLRQSEQQYRLLFETINDAVFVHLIDDEGRPGRFVQVNAVACQRLGYTEKEFLQLRPIDIAAETAKDRANDVRKTLLRNGSVLFETVHLAKDGRQVPVESHVRLFEVNGQKAVLSISRDISERKQAQAREAHIKNVLLAIRNVNQLIVSEDDPQRLIARACLNLTETMGYFNAWIALVDNNCGGATLTASAGFDGGFAVVDEQLEAGDYTACMRQALERDQTVVAHNPPTDCTDCPLSSAYGGRAGLSCRLHYGGKTFGILSVSVPAAYAHDPEEQALFHEVAGDLAFALHKIAAAEELRESRRRYREIFEGSRIERKLAQETLRQNEERFRLLADITIEGIIIHQQGIIRDANVSFAKLLGYELEEVIGKNILELAVYKDDRPIVQQNMAKNYAQPYIIRVVRKNADVFFAEIEGRDFMFKGEALRVAAVRDITEKKQLESRLQQAQKSEAIGALAGGIAHDFNNLLFLIIGLSEMLLEDLPPRSPERENVDQIFTAARRAGDLVKQILAFSRQAEPQKMPVKVQPVLKEAQRFRSFCRSSSSLRQLPDPRQYRPAQAARSGSCSLTMKRVSRECSRSRWNGSVTRLPCARAALMRWKCSRPTPKPLTW